MIVKVTIATASLFKTEWVQPCAHPEPNFCLGFRCMTMPPRIAVTEAQIDRVVERFYYAVRPEPSLGPIFAVHVTGWPAHEKIGCFWRNTFLLQRSYDGNPVQVHQAAGNVQPEHFPIWLELSDRVLAKSHLPISSSVGPPWTRPDLWADAERLRKLYSKAVFALTNGIITPTRTCWKRRRLFVVAAHDHQLQAPPFSAKDHRARGLAIRPFFLTSFFANSMKCY